MTSCREHVAVSNEGSGVFVSQVAAQPTAWERTVKANRMKTRVWTAVSRSPSAERSFLWISVCDADGCPVRPAALAVIPVRAIGWGLGLTEKMHGALQASVV